MLLSDQSITVSFAIQRCAKMRYYMRTCHRQNIQSAMIDRRKLANVVILCHTNYSILHT